MNPNQTATNDNSIEIDLGELFRVIWHHIVIVVLVTILFGGAGYAFSRFVLPVEYQTFTSVYILDKSSNSSSTTTTYTDLQVGSQLTKDYAELIKSKYVLKKVIEELNLPYTYDEMTEKVSVETPTDTRIISIYVVDTDPILAQQIATQVRTIASEHISNVMDIDAVNVVDEADVPTEKYSPHNGRNAAVAALIGFVLVCAILIIQYIQDDTIKTADDVEQYLGLVNFALIPLDEGASVNSVESLARKGRRRGKKERDVRHELERGLQMPRTTDKTTKQIKPESIVADDLEIVSMNDKSGTEKGEAK